MRGYEQVFLSSNIMTSSTVLQGMTAESKLVLELNILAENQPLQFLWLSEELKQWTNSLRWQQGNHLWAREQHVWMEADGCKQAITIISKKPDKLATVGLITGQTELNYHKCKAEKTTNPDYRFCRANMEAVEHIREDYPQGEN